MFRFIGDFLGRLWRFANFWRVSPIGQARIGSPLAGGLLFLFLLFFFIGAVLVVAGSVFGFDLSDVDGWVAAQGPWMDFVGKLIIQKALMAIVLLICIGLAVAFVLDLKGSNLLGIGRIILMLLACLFVGYCSAVNLMAPMDPYDPSVTMVE